MKEQEGKEKREKAKDKVKETPAPQEQKPTAARKKRRTASLRTCYGSVERFFYYFWLSQDG
jgi:hypothetical protein